LGADSGLGRLTPRTIAVFVAASHPEIIDSIVALLRNFCLRSGQIASIVGEMVLGLEMAGGSQREDVMFFRCLSERRVTAR
jgi:hypothetical protein